MNEGVVRRVTAWSVAVSGAGAVLWAAVAPAVAVPGIAPPRSSRPFHAASRPYALDSVARLAVARDVFRSARRPAGITYDPQRAAAPAEANQPPKPALMLVGIVAGAEPTAVIEGFPGVDGSRVVRPGDQVSGIKVVGIMRDRVRLAGMDTVWVLQVREPWKP
jgi:hypothetical protein